MQNIDIPTTQHPNSKAQIKAVLQAFEGTPKTMLQAAAISGVMRSNITWYLRDLRQSGQVEFIRFGFCPITKFRAGFYRRKEAKSCN